MGDDEDYEGDGLFLTKRMNDIDKYQNDHISPGLFIRRWRLSNTSKCVIGGTKRHIYVGKLDDGVDINKKDVSDNDIDRNGNIDFNKNGVQ